jgi:hypothetical protein
MKNFQIDPRKVAQMTCAEFAAAIQTAVKLQRLAALRREVAQLTVELAIADAKNQDASK